MTESASAHPDQSLPLDSAAQLFNRITAQLGTQLVLVSRNGPWRTAQAPAPEPVRPRTAGSATDQRPPRTSRRASA